jgi:GNAT superfamily N-acetyltransferase
MTEERLAIRAPHAGDGEGLARCWIDAGVTTARRNPDLFQVPDEEGLPEWFERLLSRESSDDICSLVAEREGQVVGSVYAALRRPIEEAERQIEREVGQPHVVVHALVVRESARRQGVGSRLLMAVEEWARERGARFVLLDTGEDNAMAIAFYERRMGYWRRARRYRKDLA